jgi:transcriptional regulator with XRE-family HTH domain
MISDDPSKLLAHARRRSRLTQRELARRAGTSQSVVARIENGTNSPSWNTLSHLMRCIGFSLYGSLGAAMPSRSHMLEDVPRILRLTPEERLRELKNAARFFAAAKRAP